MTWSEVHTLDEQCGSVLAMALEGHYLFTAGTDCTITVWDLSRLEVVKRLEGPRRPVLALEVGVVTLCEAETEPKGVAVLVAASSDNKIRVFEQSTWSLLATVEGHAGDIFCMALKGNLLCFGSQDTNVKALDLSAVLARVDDHADKKEDNLQLQALPFTVAREHLGFVYALAVYKQTLFSASGDSSIMVRDLSVVEEGLPSLAVKSVLKGHEGSIYEVLADGSCVYSAGQDGKVRVWDQETGYLRRTLSGHGAEVLAMAQTDKYLFTGDAQGELKVWDKKTLRCAHSETLDASIMVIRHKNGIVFVASGSVVRVWSGSDVEVPPSLNDIRASSDVTTVPQLPASSYGDELLLAMRDPLLKALKDFVSLRSISSKEDCRDECWRAAKFFWRLLEKYGFQAQLVEGEQHRNPLVFGRLGHDERKPTVTVYGHYDVFDVHNSEWTLNPFKVLAKNGYLYGRGVSDDKGPILAMLFACVDILNQSGELPVNVAFVVEGEEECNSAGLRKAVEQNLDWFKGTDVVLFSNSTWLGSTTPCLTYGLRGMVNVSVEVSGPSKNLHSGVDGGAISEPMIELMQLLSGIVDESGVVRIAGFYDDVLPETPEEDALYDGLEFDIGVYQQVLGVNKLVTTDAKKLLKKRWRLPTLSVHSLGTGGPKSSSTVIPASVTARISMRLVPNQSIDTIFQQFKDCIERKYADMQSSNKLEIKLLSQGDWWLADPNNRYFKAAEQSLEEVWGAKPLYTREGGTIPLTTFLERTLQAPALHLPLAQTLDGAHLADEHIRLVNLLKGKDVIRRFFEILGTTEPFENLSA